MAAHAPESGADPDAMDFDWTVKGLARSYWATAPDPAPDSSARGATAPKPTRNRPEDLLKDAKRTIQGLAKSEADAQKIWKVVTSLLNTLAEAALKPPRPTTSEPNPDIEANTTPGKHAAFAEIRRAAKEGALEGAREALREAPNPAQIRSYASVVQAAQQHVIRLQASSTPRPKPLPTRHGREVTIQQGQPPEGATPKKIQDLINRRIGGLRDIKRGSCFKFQRKPYGRLHAPAGQP